MSRKHLNKMFWTEKILQVKKKKKLNITNLFQVCLFYFFGKILAWIFW